MTAKLGLIAFFVAMAFAYNGAYLGAVAVAARGFRLAVVAFAFGSGPVLLRRGAWTLRALPVSAYFEPAYKSSLTPVEPSSALGRALSRGELRWFDDLSWPAAVLMMSLSFWVAFVGAVIGLGPVQAALATIHAVGSYLAGAFSPLAEAPRLLDAALHHCRTSSPLAVVGGASAVLAGVNLLLLPGNLLFLGSVKANQLGYLRAKVVVLLAAFALAAAWMVGFVVWMARG